MTGFAEPNPDVAPHPFPPAEIANCIVSGISGMTLTRTLQHHFPEASRADVYFAIGLAVAILQADAAILRSDLVFAEIELDMLRRGEKPPQEPESAP